jgi:hypothetical protein
MEDKIVLICATGRSGSTTMQRIINTIPNSNICGENFGAINSLLEFYRRIKKSTLINIPGKITPFTYNYIISKNIKPSWYNSYNINEIIESIREIIIKMFKINENTNLWGFKEIRYDNSNIQYIKDFKELFPQTKIIIQFRENISAQCKSGWFKNDKSATQFIAKTNKELYDFYLENTEYCFITSFEKMFDKQNIMNIFTFINCSQHYDENKVSEVLNNNIKD